jgi:hypothetical protein
MESTMRSQGKIRLFGHRSIAMVDSNVGVENKKSEIRPDDKEL